MVLRDGVLLCTLLTVLDNSLEIKSYHRKPQMAQVYCKYEFDIITKIGK